MRGRILPEISIALFALTELNIWIQNGEVGAFRLLRIFYFTIENIVDESCLKRYGGQRNFESCSSALEATTIAREPSQAETQCMFVIQRSDPIRYLLLTC